MLAAADLKTSAAFLNASSLPPIASWVSKARSGIIGDGLVTSVAEREDSGGLGGEEES